MSAVWAFGDGQRFAPGHYLAVTGNKTFKTVGVSLSITKAIFTSLLVNHLAKNCSACHAENRDIANYCLKCGTLFLPPQPQPAASAKFCLYHPTALAQVYCSDCGTPICLSCARYGLQSVYCPTCHVRRNASIFRPPPFGPALWIPYSGTQLRRNSFP